MIHNFSIVTEHVNFCSRCAKPDCTKVRREACVPIVDVEKTLDRRLFMVAMLVDAHTRQPKARRGDVPEVLKKVREKKRGKNS